MRTNHRTPGAWIESGKFAVELLCSTLGRADLDDVEVLDVGCGTKVVKTLLDQDIPIGRYAGVDAYPPVVEWLQAHVTDPRFEFHHLDAHNERYNPGGTELASFERLPVGAARFDLICLFSVFTHLAPHDFVAMLRLLRVHAKSDAVLVFSLFLEDPDHPSPYARAAIEGLDDDDPAIRERTREAIARQLGRNRGDFTDEIPDRPLEVARYRKGYALELVEGTGWEVAELHPPQRFIQHHMVCRPVAV